MVDLVAVAVELGVSNCLVHRIPSLWVSRYYRGLVDYFRRPKKRKWIDQ